MAKYLVEGGNKLSGTISISGNKNSVFPIFAAAILTEEEVIIKNVPAISDTGILIEILQSLGVEVEVANDFIRITAKKINNTSIPSELMTKLRGSIVLAGALLSRCGKATFTHPGGDIIGKRSIESHLLGFTQLGFKYSQTDLTYKVSRAFNPKLKDVVFLEEASVTATENIILASVLGRHSVTLKNCAKEPHIVDLCTILNLMGARIDGIGNSTLKISGVKKLSGCEFKIGCDFVELGSFAVAAAITKGEITMTNVDLKELEPVTVPLYKMGVNLNINNDGSVTAKASNLKAIAKLHTNIWPGFPPDLMSIFIVLATQSKGVSLMHDWMYESRMFFVDKLITMGAHITICDPHRVLVYGPTQLKGRDLESPDIRAGMALLLAALIAKGRSTVNRAEIIERGYENVVDKLLSLGAKIERFE